MSEPVQTNHTGAPAELSVADVPRRGLLKCATVGLGALWSLIIGLPAVAYLVDPRHRKSREASFRRVARLNDLPLPSADGTPVPFEAVVRESGRRDAYTVHPDEIVGRVWLLRKADGVEAFSSVCPHLGCSVNFSEGEQRFVCPCHQGHFKLTGELYTKEELGRDNPPPRGMDALPVRLVDGDDGEQYIEIKYMKFSQQTETASAKA